MTIVGYEVKRDGSSNLLVFDPGFEDEPDVVDMIGRKVLHRRYKELLELYRKDAKYLSKHDAFEVLMLVREGDDSEDRSNPGLILKLGWLHQELQNRPEGTLSRDDTMLKMGLVEGTRDNSADTGV